MRFKNYINENEVSDEYIDLIVRDCKPFLKDWKTKYGKRFLYSGRKYITNFSKKKVRKNRKPLDTPEDLHSIVDDWFYKKFGVKARSQSVFCSFDIVDAKGYGHPYVIFPIGKYKAISSPKIDDIYNILENLFLYHVGTIRFEWNWVKNDDKEDDFINDLNRELEDGDYKINQYNKSEQMVVCKEYYMINIESTIGFINFTNQLKDRL